MELHQTKQLLLKIVESVEQLDALLARETAPQEVFRPEGVALRTQIEQLSTQLIFLSPAEHGVEAEDLLWTKVYLEVIKLRKTQKTLVDRCSPEGAYRSHLKQGLRAYHDLFASVQAFFQLKLDDYTDWTPSYPVGQAVKAGSPSGEEIDWARKFCHCCLLRIGNLYHCLSEFLDSSAEMQAEKYYYKALTLIPEMGSPFMHLANLSGAKYSYVEAAYFYQCCIYSKVPHVGASLGLEQIHVQIEKLYRHLAGSLTGQPSAEPREDTKRLLVSFLYLQSLLKPSGRKDPRLERLCQAVLEDIQLCLSYLPTNDSQGSYRGLGGKQKQGRSLPNHLIFQMVVLCLLTVHGLKTAKPALRKTASSFTLAFFSHLVRLVSGRMQAALEGEAGGSSAPPRGPGPPCEESDPKEVPDLEVACESYEVLDDSDDWGDLSFSSLPDSDLSVGELLSKAKAEERRAPGDEEASGSCPQLQMLQARLDAVSGEGLLPALQVVVQWLSTEPALTRLSMVTCPGLWADLLVLMNLMPRAEELRHPDLALGPRLRELLPRFERADPPISMPLPEDVVLQTLVPLRAAHSRLDFHLDMAAPFSREEAALRACLLRTFGHFAAQLPQSLIRFDSALGLFLKETQQEETPSQRTQEPSAQSRSVKPDVGQQQLRKEVERMQKDLQLLQARAALSPYLIVDTLALCQYLSLIREMAQSGRFIVLIPRLVIDELDRRKGDEGPARSALRFLEEQLKKRNRHLRCQAQVGPKFRRPMMGREDAPAWNLYGIVFSYEDVLRVAGQEVQDVRGMVTLLTALTLDDPRGFSHPLKLAFSAAHKAGLHIKHVSTFYTQWEALG